MYSSEHTNPVIQAMRKANASAAYRIKNAMRVNRSEPLPPASGFVQQAREIRKELAKQ